MSLKKTPKFTITLANFPQNVGSNGQYLIHSLSLMDRAHKHCYHNRIYQPSAHLFIYLYAFWHIV